MAAIITPGGLGVREGILAFLLRDSFPPPLPSVLSLYGRLWATVFEGIVFIAVLLFPIARVHHREKGINRAGGDESVWEDRREDGF
jgi:uncharacterized membrane protein YbhN (UPF0104 family)